MTTSPHRTRVPSRRPAINQDVIAGNMTLSASIGFDETGMPAGAALDLIAEYETQNG
jgi:hypothetical protein